MGIQPNSDFSLKTIPANRRLIDEIFSHKLISFEAREFALNLVYPSSNWGLWVARLLTILGVTLILSGIIYFFAFNLKNLSIFVKLGSIQLAIASCLIASYYYGPENRRGKIFLLSVSILVGVFLAVFGQIYQTGANAYTLFMMWAILILPWTLIAQFTPLWALFIIISNIFFSLYWLQTVQPNSPKIFIIFSYLSVFNLVFLALGEYLRAGGAIWINLRWMRGMLVIFILSYAIISPIGLIISPHLAPLSIKIGAVISTFIYIALYITYRFKISDIIALGAVILSLCIILEVGVCKILLQILSPFSADLYLLMGIFTVIIYTFAIKYLRQISKEIKVPHV